MPDHDLLATGSGSRGEDEEDDSDGAGSDAHAFGRDPRPPLRGRGGISRRSGTPRRVAVANRNGNSTESRSLIEAAVAFPVPPDYLEQAADSKTVRLDIPAVLILKSWMADPTHWRNPYADEAEKAVLSARTGLDVTQVSNWLRNERKRVWLPLKRAAIRDLVVAAARAKVAANGVGE